MYVFMLANGLNKENLNLNLNLHGITMKQDVRKKMMNRLQDIGEL